MVEISLALAFLNGLILAYYWLLPALGRPRPRAASRGGKGPSHRFAIVVPAHNEGPTISGPLESHAALDYPKGLYEVFVIADNCTDATADVAGRAGATCLVREDARRRGKGYALGWAFEKILPLGFDALVVVDADCRLDRGALRALDRELADGAAVLQARDAVSNPDASPISYAAAVGNVIENDLFYAPKSRLGLAVMLRGTGMVFRRDVLEKYPWTARSNTEDIEFALHLIDQGVPIRFVPGTSVWSDFPEDSRQLQVQRRRWASGSVKRAGVRSLGLLARGLRRRDPRMIDAGWTQVVLSRPLLILSVAASSALALGAAAGRRDGAALAALAASAANAAALMAYFGLGIVMLGLTRRRAMMLLSAPWVVAQLAWATLLGSVGVDRAIWRQTPRAPRLAVSPRIPQSTGQQP